MLRPRAPIAIVLALLAAAHVFPGAPGAPVTPASAQGVSTATPVPGATSAGSGARVEFRCPGVTDVSAGAQVTPVAGATPVARVLSPADAAENPCVIPGSEPDIEWSASYTALRLTTSGTWQTKMRTVLTDFDALHRQYVANPRVKDMGMWPARLEETLELAELLAYQSHQDVVVYYAAALRDEYKSGIFDEHPLLVRYGLQAREILGQLASPPATPTPTSRGRR